jgi:protein-S-isoprenylcysteine O-methyltransferase Ste14
MWEIVCLTIALAGLAFRSFAVGTTPAGTSGRNTQTQVADVLNTTGMYSIVRHPLYVGNYCMWLGVALFPRIWWLPLVVTLIFWLYYERIMFAEEEFLRQRFGESFEEWAARTPAFLPNTALWMPASLPFSWRTVLRREYSGLYGLIGSFMLLELVGDCMEHGRLVVDPVWGVMFGAMTLVFIVLVLLKRHTRLLSVVGRS